MKKSILISLFSVYSLFMFSAGNIIDLSGKWNFAIDKNDIGTTEKWFSKIIQDDVIQLPGSMTENLKGDDITLDTKFTGSIYDSSWYYNPRMEKYRQPQNLKMPFWLTQNKHYVGVAWYQRAIDIPKNWSGSNVILFLEQPHFASRVWVDNTEVGSQNSLTTPHVFDLTTFLKPGKHRLTISVDNRMKDVDVGANSHSVTDHTQGNWNGIVGKMQLHARSLVHFDDIQVYPNVKNKTALVKITVRNNLKNSFKGFVSLYLGSFNSDKAQMFAPVRIPLNAAIGKTEMEYTISFGDEMLTWDEFHPALYRLTLELQVGKQTDSRELQFGMREITIDGKCFYINGRKTMLRGTVENALFPLTGYPPRDVASWERVFRICKSYGLNHMRFHSYCPPEAAFIAADKIGFYLQPEGPSWPNHSTQLGRGLPIDTYLMDETKRMVKAYGNYASFTFLACGNEPRGAWVPWVTKFVNYWKQTDSRRVYTGASVGQSWAWQPASQYHVKAGARGLDWKGNQPETLSDYGARIDSIKQPYVSHETGQWCVFPNFDEIKKYTGVTRAKNFELFQENLADNDMAELSHEFLMASGHLQALCYKHEIERTLRTPGYAGFQLLSLNDYSGQGTALVGVLDAFWDEKGYMTAPEFRHFCNSTVPLLRTEKFVYRNNETLKVAVEIAHFGELPLNNAKIIWKIRDAYGLVLEQGVMICVLAPTATAAPVIAGMLRGNVASLTAYSLISNFTVALFAPLFFSFVGYNELPFFDSVLEISRKVAVLLISPFVLALLINKFLPKTGKTIRHFSGISFYLWSLALIVVTGRTVQFVIDQGMDHFWVEVAMGVLALVVCLTQFLTGRRIGRKYDDTVAGGQGLGQKNTVLAIWMAQTFLNPISSIAPGAYVLWQNMFNSWQVWRARKTL